MLTPQHIEPVDKKKKRRKKKDAHYAFSAFQISPDPELLPKPKFVDPTTREQRPVER